MRILIVSGYFSPEITPRAFRTTQLAIELARQGHEVIVCLPFSKYDYSEYENRHNLNFIMFGDKELSQIFNYKNRFSSIMRMLMNYLFQYPKIQYKNQIASFLRDVEGFDVLISIAAPHSIHWGVNKAMRNNNKIAKKWIADCGDPFMGSRVEKLPNPFWFKKLEKEFCRKCDFITVPIKNAVESYYPEFHSKIRVIPQGFNLNEKYSKTTVNRVPTFAYSGVFYKGFRDPRPFLDMLVQIDKDFLFILYTPQWHVLDFYKEKLGDKLEIRELINRDLLLDKLSQMDFLVNFENSTGVQSPSKLIDYAIVNRPVLSISLNPTKDVVIKFLNGIYDNKEPSLNLSRYDIKNVSKQFISLINS